MNDVRPNHYVRALKYRWLTPFYDTVVAVTTRERIFRKKLLEQAEIGENDNVLDLACGSGTMAVLTKQQHPQVSVIGLDGDPEILALAWAKAHRAGLGIRFDEGLSHSLPYADSAFDGVVSSLFFHHLKADDKARTQRAPGSNFLTGAEVSIFHQAVG